MKLDKMNVAIVGLGKQSEQAHIPGVLASRFSKLSAICDVNPKKVEKWSKILDIPGYTCYYEMFKKTKLDFVIIAVPHDQYPEVVKAAIDHKINVLKEKPFARNLTEAFYLKKLCDQNTDVIIMTGMQRRFNPMYCSFELFRDLIGDIYLINATYTLCVSNPDQGWRGSKKQAGGGCIIDMGYHMIDTVIWFAGLPDAVYSSHSTNAKPEKFYDAEDTALIAFKYKNGTHGSLLLSRHYAPKKEVICFVGTNGIIEIQKECIKRFSKEGVPIDIIKIDTVDRTEKSTFGLQIDYFCRVIKGEAKNYSCPQYHLLHLSFIEACYLSQEHGKVISPKELLDNYDDNRIESE
jgi:predicted dehydrogenase